MSAAGQERNVEAKFTPGPWEIEKAGGAVDIRSKADRKPIAELWLQEDTMANAHLISAVPDLYDVADAMSKAFYMAGVAAVKDSDNPFEAILYRTRMALAKARGEQA
jgi:hypothetical protein